MLKHAIEHDSRLTRMHCATFCLFIHMFMNFWTVSTCWLLRVLSLRKWVCKYIFETLFSIPSCTEKKLMLISFINIVHYHSLSYRLYSDFPSFTLEYNFIIHSRVFWFRVKVLETLTCILLDTLGPGNSARRWRES